MSIFKFKQFDVDQTGCAMKIDLPARRPRRRINLTPMIDVVLMLLVFFMMVSRFGGTQGIGLTVAAGQGAAAGQGGEGEWCGRHAGRILAESGVLRDGGFQPRGHHRMASRPGPPARSSSRRPPRCRSAMERAIASPRPEPPAAACEPRR